MNGVPRHAHKRSTNSQGKTFRMTAEGSDFRYAFNWPGSNNHLLVFEAPIDMLSFITLHPEDWQKHSYVALCGVSDNALLWMLDQAPALQRVTLCLDNDKAGIEASHRISETLREKGYSQIEILLPSQKDWNAELTDGPVSARQEMTMNM